MSQDPAASADMPEAYDSNKLILWAAERLKANEVPMATVDAQLLLAHAMGMPREVFLMETIPTTPQQASHFLQLVELREQRVPLAKIVGMKHFWKYVFTVNGYTLDPRPDSETLIELLLTLRADEEYPYRMLDLGTGTGCLLLSALGEYKNATGLGIERNPQALEVAEENAQTLGFAERAEMRLGDWFGGLDERFDVILCNPPYIPDSAKEWLMPEVAKFEPPFALFAGEDGLDCYRTLLPHMAAHLKPGGIAIFEAGWSQADAIAILGEQCGLTHVMTLDDIGEVPRAVAFEIQLNK